MRLKKLYARSLQNYEKARYRTPPHKLFVEKRRLDKWFNILLDGKRLTKAALWLDFFVFVRQLLFVVSVTCMPGRELW